MTVKQYLEKCIKICQQYDGCDGCSLQPYSCGTPRDVGEIAECIKAVEDFDAEREKYKRIQDINDIVCCKDCIYRGTESCTAKHERADLDFCSRGKRR